MATEQVVAFKKFKNSDDAVAAANAMLELLQPRFVGPADLISSLTVLLVCMAKAHTKKDDEDEAMADLLEHIETVWESCGPDFIKEH